MHCIWMLAGAGTHAKIEQDNLNERLKLNEL